MNICQVHTHTPVFICIYTHTSTISVFTTRNLLVQRWVLSYLRLWVSQVGVGCCVGGVGAGIIYCGRGRGDWRRSWSVLPGGHALIHGIKPLSLLEGCNLVVGWKSCHCCKRDSKYWKGTQTYMGESTACKNFNSQWFRWYPIILLNSLAFLPSDILSKYLTNKPSTSWGWGM